MQALPDRQPHWPGTLKSYPFPVMLLLLTLTAADAFAHGVSDDDKAFIVQSSGMRLPSLIAAVLPAEFGIDPTGIGKTLGFTRMTAPVTATAPVIAPVAPVATIADPVVTATVAQAQTVTVTKSAVPFRSDEISLTLKPTEGTEVKATMRKGEQFVFSWEVEGGKGQLRHARRAA